MGYASGPYSYTFMFANIPLTLLQMIVMLILNLIFNTILIYILLRPSTKALFTSPPREPSLQETA